jgi:hypothetical protein
MAIARSLVSDGFAKSGERSVNAAVKNVRTNTYYLMEAKSKKMRRDAVFADATFSRRFRPDHANVQPLREGAATKSYKKKLLFCYKAFSWKISDLRAKTSPASWRAMEKSLTSTLSYIR